MSRSEEAAVLELPADCTTDLREIGAQLEKLAGQVISGELSIHTNDIPFQQLFTPLVKLYAAASEASGSEPVPVTSGTTPTEVVMVACALLRAQDLNPFDLALWFGRSPQGRESR